jgi:hypothetical protein
MVISDELMTYDRCMCWRAFGGLVRNWCCWKAIALRLSWEIEPWYWNLTRLVGELERDGVVYRGGKVDNPIKFVHFPCLFCERLRLEIVSREEAGSQLLICFGRDFW